MSSDVVWGALFAAGFGYEAYAIFNKRHGDTLSERTRAWFRTRTKPGRLAFTITWVAFSTWFLAHILGG